MRNLTLRLIALVALILLTGQTLADEWNVVRLRGSVLQLVDGAWKPLARGEIIPDSRAVATRGNGHLTLNRGNELIELGPNTQIQIYDQGGRKPFTTVIQHFGTVAVEAEVRNVQHFAVKNAYLAAVVKGTRFIVTAGRSGASVKVDRGEVSVENNKGSDTVLIVAGQTARLDKGKSIGVSGKGKPTASKSVAKTGKAKVAESKKAAVAAVEAYKAAKASGDPVAISQTLKAAQTAVAVAEAMEETVVAVEKASKSTSKADDEAAKQAAKALEEAVEAAEKAAKDAAKAAEEAAEDAAKDAKEAAEDAAKAAKDAAEDAAKAAKDAAEDAEKAAKDAAEDAEKAAKDAADAAKEAAEDAKKAEKKAAEAAEKAAKEAAEAAAKLLKKK